MTQDAPLDQRAKTAARILMEYDAWEWPAKPPADPIDYAWTAQVITDLLDALSRRVPASGGELDPKTELDQLRRELLVARSKLAASPIVAAPEGWPIKLDMVTSSQFVARVQSDALTSIAVPMIEELSKRPQTVWGDIVKALRSKAEELWHDEGDGLYFVDCAHCGWRGPRAYNLTDAWNRWQRRAAASTSTEGAGVRAAAIEECARVCDAVRPRLSAGRSRRLNQIDEHVASVADSLAARIRALNPSAPKVTTDEAEGRG